ncbi:DNA ligase D [Variovorax saccharolyticus]|uniref:DNA ligase D n=1 Tax=Variovorax saccharolyticus TaxID=3053516 RepID=UPI0025768269|nr:DNA ligase D [Variovorax sp. J31P216]MDM0028876.1 DNA ligase D [Variovorax sp. J31P216]
MAARDLPADPLERYWSKRNFAVTSEPRGQREAPRTGSLAFVVQKHAASRLHYDFRLELDGVLLSWAVPKGPSFDPADKRMAIHVEDHPLSYGSFEGTIPPKHYGAGSVIVWDRGTWEPVGDPREGLQKGKLLFTLHGHKLAGLWELVKIAKDGEKQEPWILFKKRDGFARPKADYDVLSALPDSVIAKPLRDLAAEGKTAKRPAAPRGARRTGVGAAVPGAVKAPLPPRLSPQLATLATGIPAAGQWLFEIKFDGYRIMTRIEKGQATLVTRGGHDWSARMPGLVRELNSLDLAATWLDGEIVVLDEKGLPSFNALQKAFDGGEVNAQIVYFLFDVPYFEGYDLREVALVSRRQLLQALLDEKGTEHLRFSAAFEADPASVLSSACRMNLEGVIAKRADAPYASRRTETWLKLKCQQRQEFVVAGYTNRSDGSPQIGSLLLGVHAPSGALLSVGSVGTGWNAEEATALKRKLSELEIAKPPFPAGAAKPGRWSKRAPGSERWVEPKLVAEVAFAEWTPDGQIRHATYVSLRSDKPAASIVRETAKALGDAGPVRTAGKAAVGAIKVSNADRVIDPSTGLTKLDLVRYYESVADWILPHLQGRPCSLVRGPTGVTGELFFQKHDEKISIPGIQELPASLWPGHGALLEVGSAQALASAAQMNVIEFHTWNSKAKHIDRPDRMIFDLDPGEGTSWQHVQEAAVLVRALLTGLGLEAWLKTSGGKGLHVVVPIAPRLDYDTVKGFSQAVVQHLARTIPARFVAKSGPSNRVGKLFVDFLRNGHGATTAAAFSARARPGLGVSMPVAWDDLSTLQSGAQWTIATAREHLSFQTTDPWSGYWKKRQTLAGAMKVLGYPRA